MTIQQWHFIQRLIQHIHISQEFQLDHVYFFSNKIQSHCTLLLYTLLPPPNPTPPPPPPPSTPPPPSNPPPPPPIPHTPNTFHLQYLDAFTQFLCTIFHNKAHILWHQAFSIPLVAHHDIFTELLELTRICKQHWKIITLINRSNCLNISRCTPYNNIYIEKITKPTDCALPWMHYNIFARIAVRYETIHFAFVFVICWIT